MKRLTVRNDFHNTEIYLLIPDDNVTTLTRFQARRINKELCGSPECQCGGMRGDQDFEYEHVLIRDDYGYEYETYKIDTCEEVAS